MVGRYGHYRPLLKHMATATDYRLDGMPRVRVLCALTGELIYEPTHPWLEQSRAHLLKTGPRSIEGPICQQHSPCFTYTLR